MTSTLHTLTPQTSPARPLRSDEPLPQRKVIRSWLRPLSQRSTGRALGLLALDYTLWLALLAGVVLADAVRLKLLCGLVAGLVIGRLFVVGHDACHQSLTPRPRLNKWLGRLAFLPSLTAYSLWDVGHNMVHHGFTNLKGVDFVWAPLTQAEFDALSPGRCRLERIYRSGWGPGLYYMVEIWWRRMMFPSRTNLSNTKQSVFLWDCLLATVFAAPGCRFWGLPPGSTGNQSPWRCWRVLRCRCWSGST